MTLDTLNFLLIRKYYLRLGSQTDQTVIIYERVRLLQHIFATYFKMALLSSRSSLL